MKKPKVLIVDDESNIRKILQASLEKAGITAAVAESGEAALKLLEQERFDCLLTDVTMPGIDGFELQQAASAAYPEMPVVIMTAYGTIPSAVKAIRDGAFEFVTKPFDLDNVKRIVRAAVRSTGESAEHQPYAERAPSRKFIAESRAMKELLSIVGRVADSRATVLINGESGSGKEVIARLIHDLSPRSSQPYIALNCAAFPETLIESELFGYVKGAFTGAETDKKGRFETAQGGTLFLDEIGDLPLTTQVKLLRVLQERMVEPLGATTPTAIDVRLVTATNKNLQQAVDHKEFRLDLMYRLQVVEIVVPPLRERPEDIKPLADHFLERFCKENSRPVLSVPEPLLASLLAYGWPGNVRELENMMERAVVLSRPEDTELRKEQMPARLFLAA